METVLSIMILIGIILFVIGIISLIVSYRRHTSKRNSLVLIVLGWLLAIGTIFIP